MNDFTGNDNVNGQRNAIEFESLFRRIVHFSTFSLLLTSPFFLYYLFERPSVSQEKYISICALSIGALYFLVASFLKPRISFRKIYFLLPALLFFLLLTLSALWSETPVYSLKEALFQISLAIIFTGIVISGYDSRLAGKIILIAGVNAFLAAFYGILQNYGVEILGYSEELKKGKLSVVSIFGHPNYLAAYLAPVMILILNEMLSGKLVKKAVCFLVIFSIALCLLLAGARGAWLSLLISIPFLILFRKRSRSEVIKPLNLLKWSVPVIIVFLVIIVVLLPLAAPRYNIRERLQDSMPLLSRFYSWTIAGEMLKDHPVTGTGYGRYKVLYWEYVDRFQQEPENRVYDYLLNYGEGIPPLNVHNEYLEFAAETGIAGFLAFMFFIIFLFINSWKILPLSGDFRMAGIAASLVCILIDSIFNFPLHQPLSALLFWMLCALLCSWLSLCPEIGDKHLE